MTRTAATFPFEGPPASCVADAVRTLAWPLGEAQLQRLGGMLGPVTFRAAGHADFAPMQVAPWADEADSAALPGILRRLRGEWPCVPFGRTDLPPGLPAGWQPGVARVGWGHGFASHHEWQWLPEEVPFSLAMGITYPADQPVLRLTRRVRAVPDAPALNISLQIEVREPCLLPVALHPTFRMDAGRVELNIEHRGNGLTYPVPAEAGISRLQADATFARLDKVPLQGGTTADLSRFPLAFDTEELLQLQAISAPVELRYVDLGWTLQLDWDRSLLPDLMLWVSHRGRTAPPWSGRHWAIGVEPVNGAFDLGCVATPPPGHGARRHMGLALHPEHPLTLEYRLAARPGA
jgi:hypothetical protein